MCREELPQDGRFDIQIETGNSMDVRVSTFPTVYGEKVVHETSGAGVSKAITGGFEYDS